MSHLAEHASDLLDGRLPAAQTELAHAHLATCSPCREQVENLRLVKYRLSVMEGPEPSMNLTATLLAIGGVSPSGAVPVTAGAASGLVVGAQLDDGPAGSRRPFGLGAVGRRSSSGPGRGPSATRRRRPARARMAAAMAGSFTLVGAGLLAASVLSPTANATITPSANLVLARNMVTMGGLPILNVPSAWQVAQRASAP